MIGFQILMDPLGSQALIHFLQDRFPVRITLACGAALRFWLILKTRHQLAHFRLRVRPLLSQLLLELANVPIDGLTVNVQQSGNLTIGMARSVQGFY